MNIKLNYRIIIVTFVLIYLPISLTLEKFFLKDFWGYGDEIFALCMFFYLFTLFIKGKILKKDLNILILLILLTLLGLISNWNSKLIDNSFAITIDAFWQWKIFLAFLGAKYIAKRNAKDIIIKSLLNISKMFLIVSCLCGIISCFLDLGMTYEVRYGIPSYYFIFYNEGRFGIIVAIALLIILKGTTNKKIRRKYEILALINMILTTKGIVYIIIVMYVLLQILFKYVDKRGNLNLKILIPLCIGIIGASSFQIENYLLNDISPRMLLLRYGIVTAQKYFPLGSGFATYGSEMAARYYSPLYVEYGWQYRYTMGIENGTALNDNYLATIIGELGFFGVVIIIWIFIEIFKQINSINEEFKVKSMILSLFMCMMVAFLATGITKSSIGVCVFVILGVLTDNGEYGNLKKKM